MKTREEILRAQRFLNSVGFSVVIDGLWGPETEGAMLELAFFTVREVSDTDADEQEELLRKEIRFEEGEKLYAYKDSLGFWTIGIGRLIDKRKGGRITAAESAYLFANDIEHFRLDLDRVIPWWRKLSPVRQRAVQNMAFQMGTGDFTGPTFNLIRDGRYKEAAARLRGWKWAKQTPARAKRMIRMIETGNVRKRKV